MVEEKDYLEETEKSETWKDKLLKDSYLIKGVTVERIKTCPDNYIIFLENYPKYAGKLMYNKYTEMREFDGKDFDDDVENIMYNDAIREMGFHSRDFLASALSEVFLKHSYNPIIDYLESLKWDGKKRIETLFINMLGADDTELNRAFTRKWMIAAVKRCYHPGCKFDPMIVLQGSGGIGKSTMCERLSKGFYSSISLDEIDNKDLVAKMNRTWIGLIDELDSFKKKDMEKIKNFLSETENTVRLAYARNPKPFKRHCVFIGTTNDDTFLRDNTSSVERRFWIIKCNKTKMDSTVYDTMTPEYVDQLWAEALHYYNENPNQYLDLEQKLFGDFAEVQKGFKVYEDDPMIEYIRDILDKKYNINDDGEVTDIGQIDDFGPGKRNSINKIKSTVLSAIIRREFKPKMGYSINKYIESALAGEWEYKQTRFMSLGNESKKGWVRINKVDNPKKAYDPMDEFTVGLNI